MCTQGRLPRHAARYNLILKPVKAEAEAKVLFTKEEVDSLSVDEMHRRLKEEIRYNEFEYQEKNHISSGAQKHGARAQYPAI